MTNNDKITRKCCCCSRPFTTVRDEDQQFAHEANGFCSYFCESKIMDAYNEYDRWAKP